MSDVQMTPPPPQSQNVNVFSPLLPPPQLMEPIDDAMEVDDHPGCGELDTNAQREYALGQPVWNLLSTSGTPPRRACCMSVVRYNDKLYVYGGGVIKRIYAELYEYDINTRVWRNVEATGECAPPLLSHTAVVMGDEMVIYGGMGHGMCYDETYALNLNTFVWRRLRPNNGRPPAARKGHTAVTFGGKMFVCMGAQYMGDIFSDLHAFDPTTCNWEQVQDAFGRNTVAHMSGRTGHSATVWGNEMVLFGGMAMEKGVSEWMNDVHSFNFNTKMWRNLTASPAVPTAPCGRYSHASWVAGNKLFVFGGDSSDCCAYFNDLWQFDLNKREWKQLPTTGDAPAPRSGHVAVTHSGEVYMLGGERPTSDQQEPGTPCTPPSESEVEYSNCLYRLPLFIAPETTLADVMLRFCVQQRVLDNLECLPESLVERLSDLMPRVAGSESSTFESPNSPSHRLLKRPRRDVPPLAPLAYPTLTLPQPCASVLE